jgi:hypothetical protein
MKRTFLLLSVLFALSAHGASIIDSVKYFEEAALYGDNIELLVMERTTTFDTDSMYMELTVEINVDDTVLVTKEYRNITYEMPKVMQDESYLWYSIDYAIPILTMINNISEQFVDEDLKLVHYRRVIKER